METEVLQEGLGWKVGRVKTRFKSAVGAKPDTTIDLYETRRKRRVVTRVV